MRVGLGYDIHRLTPGRPLVLGGLAIPHDRGLLGHSDADVVIHALMDALLGAAGLGDIGHHFPPSDERYRGASSLVLLATVSDLLAGAGWEVVNADIVLVAEGPRIGPFRDQMRAALARTLAVDPADVNIKATTNEGVGPEGREEAISASAVVLVQRAG